MTQREYDYQRFCNEFMRITGLHPDDLPDRNWFDEYEIEEDWKLAAAEAAEDFNENPYEFGP